MKSVPPHLQRYVVEQNYDRYTPEDQAVWRFIMRQLINYLSQKAHPCYLKGLQQTGITSHKIPLIEEMNEKLHEFGWGAVPVSGFIPPAAFMEFQALGFLPIASDMRNMEHILYTPAPDIVHEAAGHAPILIDPQYAKYLKSYAEVANKAIISREDLDLYEAIRILSDVKEHPDSTESQILEKEQALLSTVSKMTSVSEASLLSRMNWWTAEYGLIGDINNPKIYGAGLLSSVGESETCLSDKVKKIPFSIECIDYSYDITEPQPQLFVTPDFESLTEVLNEFSEKMAFKKGGAYGLQLAKEAETVNTVEVDTGLQISGRLIDYFENNGDVFFLKFDGPSQLCCHSQELEGHGQNYHSHGYSTPLGPFNSNKEVSQWDKGDQLTLNYDSGITVEGTLLSNTSHQTHKLLYSFEKCTVKFQDQVLFDPAWGTFDLALGQTVTSVYGGPADRPAFGEVETFVAKRVPKRSLTDGQKNLNLLFERTRKLQSNSISQENNSEQVLTLINEFLTHSPSTWLLGVELLELCHKFDMGSKTIDQLVQHLEKLKNQNIGLSKCIDDGISLSRVEL